MTSSAESRVYHSVWAESALCAGIPIFMVLDGDDEAKTASRKLKSKRKDKKKLIEPNRIYNFHKQTIEDYYPSHLLEAALFERFALSDESKENLTKAIKSNARAKNIQKVLWESENSDVSFWKVIAAEYIARETSFEEIDEEVQALLHKINDIFEEHWNPE